MILKVTKPVPAEVSIDIFCHELREKDELHESILFSVLSFRIILPLLIWEVLLVFAIQYNPAIIFWK